MKGQAFFLVWMWPISLPRSILSTQKLLKRREILSKNEPHLLEHAMIFLCIRFGLGYLDSLIPNLEGNTLQLCYSPRHYFLEYSC